MQFSPLKLARFGIAPEDSIPAAGAGGHRVGKPGMSRLRAGVAFTLVEMLVVMGIIVLLITATVPTFKGLLGGRGVNASINSVAGILELARETAISSRTYTYVCFKNVVNSDNTCELRCMASQSRTGLSYLDAATIRPITKLLRMPNVKNVKFKDMPLAVQNVTPTTPPDLRNDGAYIAGWYATETSSHFPQVIVDGENFQGATYIQFGQDGTIGTSDPYNLLVQPVICLGLIGTRGTTVQTNANDGAIVAAYGASGQLQIIRP